MPIGELLERYERLEVIGLIPEKIGKRHAQIKVRCDCGVVKVIRRGNFRQGRTTSCGCWRREHAKTRARHNAKAPGMSGARTVYCTYLKDAAKRGLEFRLNFEQFCEITQRNCTYCDDAPRNVCSPGYSTGPYIYNGIDRMDSSLGYTVENVTPCCRICNRGKSDLTMQQWREYLSRLSK